MGTKSCYHGYRRSYFTIVTVAMVTVTPSYIHIIHLSNSFTTQQLIFSPYLTISWCEVVSACLTLAYNALAHVSTSRVMSSSSLKPLGFHKSSLKSIWYPLEWGIHCVKLPWLQLPWLPWQEVGELYLKSIWYPLEWGL